MEFRYKITENQNYLRHPISFLQDGELVYSKSDAPMGSGRDEIARPECMKLFDWFTQGLYRREH